MIPVVIMCGGQGMRLHPLTETHPKPLFKVGGKAILEQIIEGFVAQGFRKFWLCVNYRAGLIEKHFGSGINGCKIKYVHEAEPLGTAGALRMLPKFDTPFIVSNGDVLTKITYGNLMETHARANTQITVCLALHQHQLPFGVARFEGDRFVGVDEKPIQSVLVSAGIYVLDPSTVALIPDGRFDMPDLIGKCDRLAYYPIEDSWFDVGNFVDLARANNEWNQ